MRKKAVLLGVGLIATALAMAACGKKENPEEQGPSPTAEAVTEAPDNGAENEDSVTSTGEEEKKETEDKELTNLELEAKWKEKFEGLTLAETLKEIGLDTPVMTQRLGADPYAIVYEGRVYLYMTGDLVEYDSEGNAKPNSYSKINKLNVISSDDLVNWTDHGTIYAASRDGAAKWGNNSWAPAVAYKEIDGKMKFFVYFANGGNGIGVLSADSPVGPFTDPIKQALISRSTPNCANVDWLFDPAVLVDDDGSAYIYFGGGVPEGKTANPGTGRVAKLGADMISIDGEPVAMDIPYLFEDSGINKIGDTYYYSYCTNWNVDEEATKKYGFTNANIAYMTSKNPMGPFTYQGVVLLNPGTYYGCYGNNHHCMFEFNGELYIAYHTQILEKPMGISGGYRCTSISKVTVNEDGTIATIPSVDRHSLVQQKYLNPYEKVEAETMATMGGLNTTQEGMVSKSYGSGNMVLSEIHSGDWLALYGVDFGETGATKFTAAVKAGKEQTGAIQIRLDSLDGEVAGYLEIGKNADGKTYQEYTAELLKTVTGVHNLIFVFYGEEYNVDYWQFQ
ncbi:MAG: glycoside hydrolase family 43 protein [Lachnospiraceae bacterium]|nr:glycoside hydrolase family 43 protein [Lachnospiraceae bacterium]